MKTKIITAALSSELEEKVNLWLLENESKVEVFDIKYSSNISNYSVCIFYRING